MTIFCFLKAVTAEEKPIVYLSKDLSANQDQLLNLCIMEMVIRNAQQTTISVGVATQPFFSQTVWINYYFGNGQATYGSLGKTLTIPLGSSPPDWTAVQRNIADDLQPFGYNFSYVKQISIRGTQADLKEIAFSSHQGTLFSLNFSSWIDGSMIEDLGWSSNNKAEYFPILHDNDDSFNYLSIGSNASVSQSSEEKTTTSQNMEKDTCVIYNYIQSNIQLGNSLRNEASGSYYPSTFNPFWTPYSSYGFYSGLPFGTGFNPWQSPLLALGSFGLPLGGISGIFGMGGNAWSSLGSGNYLKGTLGDDSWYESFFANLIKGAIPATEVVAAPVTVFSPSTVLPQTITPLSLAPTVIPTLSPTTKPTGGGGGTGGGGTGGGTGGGWGGIIP